MFRDRLGLTSPSFFERSTVDLFQIRGTYPLLKGEPPFGPFLLPSVSLLVRSRSFPAVLVEFLVKREPTGTVSLQLCDRCPPQPELLVPHTDFLLMGLPPWSIFFRRKDSSPPWASSSPAALDGSVFPSSFRSLSFP